MIARRVAITVAVLLGAVGATSACTTKDNGGVVTPTATTATTR